jgi:hypothetical protein
MRLVRVGCMVIILGCSFTGIAAAGALRVIYVSPRGNDRNEGTLSDPMLTLNAVDARLQGEAPDTDVDIRCISTQGTFWNQFVEWEYFSPTHVTTIRGYPTGTRARFEMADSAASTLPWFTFRAATSQPTHIVIRDLLILKYNAGGMVFKGGWPETDGWNGYNVIRNCIFAEMGNFGRSAPICYGMLDFVSSIENVIDGCTFYHGQNNANPPIVAIYLAHDSRGNLIQGNTFRGIAGDCIKLRDGANANEIGCNTFIRSGNNANVIAWYCDESIEEVSCSEREQPCDSTIIADNIAWGASNCDMAVLWKDMMQYLKPIPGRCSPCMGLPSKAVLLGNVIETCRVSDGANNDVAPY